ncbi:hypothetical protein KXD93_24540 [Mucilaginibacter sp. BJC16-A38]|uniref:hypothetical protein n=1 Tax=Mucilaginibacter phenanthrenivorans TaxID=1234842 RepID=UPI00215871DD|nr:hypothetical protein [Mucilaginibacter phenanthrenivorans]MCR8560849.1 hypothetical protein [Mucilaginibacter phenanthrenivorans]
MAPNLRLPLLVFFITSVVSAFAQKQSLYVEPKQNNNKGISPYNYDNTIYVEGKTYIYDYIIVKGKDTLKYAITSDPDGSKSWKYVPALRKDSNTVSYLGIKTLGKIGPIMMDKPDYNQTEIFLYHYSPNLKPLETELTGVIENKVNVWLHPFRFHALEILQLSPFPYAKIPYHLGQTYYWNLNIGKQWPEFKAFNWKGNLNLKCKYVVRGKEILTLPFGTVQVIKIEGTAKTEAGSSNLTSYFSEQFGFVKLIYSNLDGSSIVFILREIK